MTIAATILLILLAILTLFQLALIFGAPLGRFAWGGSHKVLPSKLRIGSGVAILIYAFVAVLVLNKVGVLSSITNNAVLAFGLWITFAYFTMGIFMNGISKSKPERLTMTPLCAVLAICMFFVAIG